jgi:hypothetical protein
LTQDLFIEKEESKSGEKKEKLATQFLFVCQQAWFLETDRTYETLESLAGFSEGPV